MQSTSAPTAGGKSSTKASARREQALADATKRTLLELKDALAKTQHAQTGNLAGALDGRDGNAVMRELLNIDSPLCAAIPVQHLEKSAQGRRYLDLLTIIQPGLKSRHQTASLTTGSKISHEQSDAGEDVQQALARTIVGSVGEELVVPEKKDTNATDALSQLPDLFPGAETGQLGDLVREVLASGELSRMNGEAPQMDDLTNMFGTVSQIISKKAAEGTLDLAALDSQAQSMLGRLSTDHPELRSMLSNPNIASMMAGAMTSFPQ